MNAGRAVFLSAFVVSGTVAAAPWTVEQCVEASTEGQRLQLEGSLLAARKQLELCGDPSCPAVVQSACTKWLDEALAATPSVIVVARLDGVDQPQARVLLDAQPWLSELSGKPQSLDPGEHRIAVEVAGLTQEQRVVINVGEKNRLLSFAFARPVAVADPVAAARPAPILPLALSATAIAGGAIFAGLGLSGRAALDRLTSSACASSKTCDPAAVSAIQRTFAGADIALTLGVLSAAVATWQWWRWSVAEPPAVVLTPVVTPGPQGGPGLQLSGAW